MNTILESGWNKIRNLKDIAISRACDSIFEKVEKVASSRRGQEHKAKLDLFELIKKEDRKIAEMFDGLRRSSAIFQLSAWRFNKVITDDEFATFSDESQ